MSAELATRTLSEADSKELLAPYGVPFPAERVVSTPAEAAAAAEAMGFPAVAKLCGDAIAHKTERGLVRLHLADPDAVAEAATSLLDAARPEDGEVGVLVAPMIAGARELICGLSLDPQFGPTVMVGLGGIAAEALADVSIRLVPITRADAAAMLDELAAQALLGEFRGEPAVDREGVVDALMALNDVAVARPDVVSVDLNPLIVGAGGRPVAVDALVELADGAAHPGSAAAAGVRGARAAGFSALFDPKGVVVAGASTHPGKFGFVSLHNILANGYEGAVFATNLDGAPVLGVDTLRSIDELPEGAADLVFVCTPKAANPDLLRACAAKGIRAAFLTSAGYGEAGEAGRAEEAELVAVCDELGLLLAGPNGQGVVSTPAHLCAQIVAPYPPAGAIGVASQSGNFVSSFLNMATATGIGISRAVSAGNAAAVTVADYLTHYADDEATRVSLAYVEGIDDGRAFFDAVAAITPRKPVVLVKGGATAGGARAASSHTGSLATDDRVFDGACRQAGVTRAATIEEAFEAAATLATQPLPPGNRVVVMTTAGGWGVVTADAISASDVLQLVELPDDLLAEIDTLLPPRWSRNNPVDLAGGETRDTIPQVMEIIARHPAVDSIVYLGLGIQSNQAEMMASGRFYPDHGLERIVEYHRRQDARFAQAAADISTATGKPILTATELAVADPTNAGPATVRATGRLCYASANRAVTALEHLTRYAAFRQGRR
ncbi:MAG: acetate--CoA ligase family protein [Acidimicrobiales bacterium]